MSTLPTTPFLFSQDSFLTLSDDLLFPSDANEEGSVDFSREAELASLWQGLQVLSQRMGDLVIQSEATIFDIEQLNLNRAIALIDIAAVWLLFIANNRQMLEQEFVRSHVEAIHILVAELNDWLDAER